MEEYIWKKLGLSEDYGIDERLMMSVTLLSAICLLLLGIPVFLQDFTIPSFYIVLLGLGLGLTYIIVRFWRKLIIAKYLFFLLSILFAVLLFPLTGYLKGPVISCLLVYYLLSLMIAGSRLEQRFYLLYIIGLGAYLIFFLLPLPNLASTLVYFFSFLGFSIIFYIGALYVKHLLDSSISDLETKTKSLIRLKQEMDQQNIETKELAAQKDRLFSIIGHDLRSPLSGIEGFLNVIEYGGVPDDERKIMSNELLRLTRNSRALLDNLLRWAKRDTKAYEASEVDYPKLIQMVGEHLRPLGEAKGIKIQVLIDEGEGTVLGDADMLEMVIRNLISNAIKFTPSGGWIKIRAYEMESELRLEVEDNGIGMTNEQRLKLFSPHREVGLGTNKEKGVGLGLMLCVEFLGYMNGKIEVRSVKDKGSCFTVHLPRKKGASYGL